MIILFLTLFFSTTLVAQQLYDIHKTFTDNMAFPFTGKIPVIKRKPQEQWLNFLGYKIASPLGVPACAITTGQKIGVLAKLGFDVVTYKTIRAKPFKGHPFPNIFHVDQKTQLTASDINTEVQVIHENTGPIAIANSFGNISFEREFLHNDITRAKKSLHQGQVLIVSVFGETSQEFVEAALLAQQAGADIIEANFSCPNLCGKLLYTDLVSVTEISQALVQALGNVPVIIKVGYFENTALMKNIIQAAHDVGIRGICGINSIPMKIMQGSSPAFGPTRRVSGVSGNPIRTLALTFVQQAHQIIKDEKLNLALLATGGITQPHHFDEFLHEGATIALSATGTMFNPYLAAAYHAINSKL